MIKAAFFDIDGTLFSLDTRTVAQSTREAIARLQAAGILCVVATGRQIKEMGKLPVADIPFDAYITLNGQLILDKEKNTLFSTPLTGASREQVLEDFRTKKYPAMLVEDDRTYINYVSDHVRAVHEYIASPIPELGTYNGGSLYQVCVYLRPEEEYLIQPLLPHCEATRWHFGGLDIIAKGGGKIAGIQRYLEHMGLRPEQIIAFGDGENDIDMLRFAGIGVAMDNGCPGAKAAADYVTTDVDSDGIANALKYFNLI